ncbi:MAG: PRC-barrel domain-containing protein [Solirubrobacteraceae bacterium]
MQTPTRTEETATAARRLKLGEPIRCRDGVLGELADIVVDPEARRVTHLVARADGGGGTKRLIPYELVDRAEGADRVSLDCTLADAHGLKQAQELSYLPGGQLSENDPEWDIGVQDVFLVPRYDSSVFVDYQPEAEPEIMHMYDRIPKGHVEVRRESSITTADGYPVGSLAGVVVEEQKLTHLILRSGHLWRRHSVMLPVSAVGALQTDEVIISCSKRELRGLPRCD